MRRTIVLLSILLSIVPAQAATALAQPSPIVQSRVGAPLKQAGTIVISKLKLKAPIYIGITDSVFDKGVGQWPGTPTAGKKGNIVLGGHRTSANAPFMNIHKLKSGDIISLSVKNKTYKYKVTGHSIVKPTAVWITKQTATPTLTLFSCHPFGKVSHRYVVRAVLAK
jgi:sortase A